MHLYQSHFSSISEKRSCHSNRSVSMQSLRIKQFKRTLPFPSSTSYAVSPKRAIQTRSIIFNARLSPKLSESSNSDAPLQFPASNFHTGTLNRAIWTHPVIPIIQFPQSLSESSNSNAHCHSHHPLPTQFLQNEQFRRAPSFSLLGFHAVSPN